MYGETEITTFWMPRSRGNRRSAPWRWPNVDRLGRAVAVRQRCYRIIVQPVPPISRNLFHADTVCHRRDLAPQRARRINLLDGRKENDLDADYAHRHPGRDEEYRHTATYTPDHRYHHQRQQP